jgi:hypothetical protein
MGFTSSFGYVERFVGPFGGFGLIFRPYLVKDFVGHVVSTVKGGGSRGGYSAL